MKQACKLVGVGASTLRKWVADGRLPKHGRGRILRFRRSDVIRAMSSGGEQVLDLHEMARRIRAKQR